MNSRALKRAKKGREKRKREERSRKAGKEKAAHVASDGAVIKQEISAALTKMWGWFNRWAVAYTA
jgi:hypothetical protein